MHGRFQSTLSMRRATIGVPLVLKLFKFQSTLSMRRATDAFVLSLLSLLISIHALHEESDYQRSIGTPKAKRISIHALHEESDAGTRRVRPRHAISIHALHEESDQKRGS